MTIGHHELSICRASRRLSSRYLHFCSITKSFITPTAQQRRTMSSRNTAGSVLWSRGSGIRFSPRSQMKRLYPELDLSRYISDLHDAPKAEGVSSDTPGSGDQPPASSFDSTQPSLGATDSSYQPSIQTDDVEAEEAREHDIADSQPSEAERPSTPVEPPSTSLPYQISPELFQKARGSPEGSPASYWSHTMYKREQDDGKPQNVKVHYCFSKKTMEWVCQKYFVGEPVLGFDLEWLPWATGKGTARQNVSLIQLASAGRIALFHCSLFAKDDFVADTFRKIMEDSNVCKVGVAIKADCTRLEKWMGVKTKGIIELSHLHKIVKYTRERRPDLIKKSLVPLASLVQEYLGLPLYKGDAVRSSDWTRPLNTKQITYSAADAYAGIQLYHVIDEARQKLDPCPSGPPFAELSMPLPIPIFPAKDIEEVAAIAAQKDQEPTAPKTPQTTTKEEVGAAATVSIVDQRITAAESQARKYREEKPTPCLVPLSALRAYYMWQGDATLKPDDIAKLLREPPLQTNTVIGYILSSVTAEQLPYRKDRMRDEVLAALAPEALKSTRYQALIRECHGKVEVDHSPQVYG